MYNYNTYDVSQTSGLERLFEDAAPALVILAIFLALVCLAVIILVIVANCKIFKKAGEKQWKALIPVYSTWVNTRIAGLGWWWFLIFMAFTIVVGTVTNASGIFTWCLCLISFNYSYCLAKKFGKSNGFAFLMTILPVIALPILGFGSAKYDKGAKVDKNGIFAVEK